MARQKDMELKADQELAEQRLKDEKKRLEEHSKRLQQQEAAEQKRQQEQELVEECESCGKKRSGGGACHNCGYYKPWGSVAPVRKSDAEKGAAEKTSRGPKKTV